MGALDGLKVVDLSRVLAGPFCGQMFAENGAEVIKVEGPEGDLNRAFPMVLSEGESTNFQSVNRGKKDITLNLKSAKALAVLYKLIERADVLIQSFLPNVSEKLGVGWDEIHALNPDLIYVSISGYGAEGPLRNKPGYDTMVAAYSGVMSLNGEPDRPPVRLGVTAIDLSTGMLAYSGAMTALMARERGQARGQRVNVSLLESGVTLLGFHGVSWLQTGHLDQREGAGYLTLAPYGAFRAKDGDILIGAPTEAMWKKACAVLGMSELEEDPRFRTNAVRCDNRDALREEIEARLASATITEWTERLEAGGVATSPINTIDTVLSDPQVLANNMIVDCPTPDGGSKPLLGLPFKLTETPGDPGAAPPAQGQHNREVLSEILGLSDADIDALVADGAI
jgi:crotonobetainyl-CoA:carnitine CoA-transferase CaiB-like acyl-CoA transferase